MTSAPISTAWPSIRPPSKPHRSAVPPRRRSRMSSLRDVTGSHLEGIRNAFASNRDHRGGKRGIVIGQTFIALLCHGNTESPPLSAATSPET
jgi:hypothetical protein